MTRVCALLFAATLVASAAAPARAFADEEAARVAFRKGVDLYDKKQFAEALEAFKTAYAEKPSAGIKQNIALCLKGLGRVVEAATAFDEALDEGRATLKPETRAAIERELAELDKVVATVHMRVVGADNAPLENAIVSVDGAALAPGAHRRPIRLAQGIHTFTAYVEGFPDPPAKKLALLLGQPVDATFIVTRVGGGASAGATGESTVTVRANVDDAVIKIDGAEVGRGTWTGKLAPGSHQIVVSAPDHRTFSNDITIPVGATTIEQPVVLTKASEPPGPYDHVERKPPVPHKLYIVPALAFFGVSYRFAEPLGEEPSGERRTFGGASLGVRGGYKLSRLLAGEVNAELGFVGAQYRLNDADTRDTETNITLWRLMPMLRLATPGKVRFTAGTGFGVQGASVDAKLVAGAGTTNKKGAGVGFSWLIDVGLQFDVGPVFMEAILFTDVHGTGAVKDAETDRRFFQASPATRTGLRLGLGIPF